MAKPQLIQLLSDLTSKIESLMEERKKLLERNEELEKRNNFLEEQHNQDIQLLHQADLDIEYLKISHRLAESPDTIIQARRKILGLIRTINNSIRMLKEE